MVDVQIAVAAGVPLRFVRVRFTAAHGSLPPSGVGRRWWHNFLESVWNPGSAAYWYRQDGSRIKFTLSGGV